MEIYVSSGNSLVDMEIKGMVSSLFVLVVITMSIFLESANMYL